MMNEDGMTNVQYKGMLLDELDCWENAKEIAEASNCEDVIEYAKKQIEKIEAKLRF